jgi:hypothetical protein
MLMFNRGISYDTILRIGLKVYIQDIKEATQEL